MSQRFQFSLKTVLWIVTWLAIAVALWSSSSWLWEDLAIDPFARRGIAGSFMAAAVLTFVGWRIASVLLQIRDLDL